MYLKLKIDKEEELKKKKRRPALWVVLAHIIVLAAVFCIFSIKGCSTPKEQPIRVNLITQSEALKEVNNSRQVENVKKINEPKPKNNIKKTPAKKKWKALDPTQIKKSNTRIVKKDYKPRQTQPTVSASDIAANIRKNISSIKVNNSLNASNTTLQYYDKVSMFLYDRWNQPSRAAVGGGFPVVNVKISVDSSGRILNTRIVKKSGIHAMDSSVKNLLSNIKYLPKPPDGAITVDVFLQLSD